MPRPNFILVTTDQQRADHLGCYGAPLLRTPAIDSLAARGVVFERCYVGTPVCMPNRAAMMTGRMPSAAGARMNGVPLPLDALTFVDALRGAGWRTALFGKCHLQNMTGATPTWLREAGAADSCGQGLREIRGGEAYRQESIERWQDPAHRVRLPYYGFEHVELCLEHGDLVGGDYERWLRRKGCDPAALRGPANALPHAAPAALDAWRTAVPVELYPSTFVVERTIDWIAAHRAGPAGADPFFVHCSFPDPHHPYTPPGKYWDMYSPEDVALPATCAPAGPDDVPLKRALHAELAEGRRNRGGSRAMAVTAAEARAAIALNFGAIALIDDALGRLFAHLERAGLAGNTVIIFASDHGDFMGEHGLLNKGPLHYRSVIRTPLIWADPAGPGASRSSGLCSTIDLAPTILARAGVPPYRGMQGRDLFVAPGAGVAPIAAAAPGVPGGARGPVGAIGPGGWGGPGGPAPAAASLATAAGTSTSDGRDAVLIEEESHHRYPGAPFPLRVRTLVTARWRLSVRGGESWGELYDLEADPEERTNRWSDPALAQQKSDLLLRLVDEMQRHADDLPLPLRMA